MLHKAIALTASVAVAGLMWMILAAAVAPHAGPRQTGFSVDHLRMADGCVDGRPVYYAPDGRLWTWSGAWLEVRPEARAVCAVQTG